MLADLRDDRLLGGGDPHAVRAQRPDDAPGDDRLLLAVLLRAQELLAEMVIDGRPRCGGSSRPVRAVPALRPRGAGAARGWRR